MKKTGQLLREAREASGISLQEVSVHLKISIRVLKALEEGNESQLPAKTFLRGFVKSYAQFLKLDQDKALELFQQEMGSTHPKMITKYVEMAAEPPKSVLPTVHRESEEEAVSVDPEPVIPATPTPSVKADSFVAAPLPPAISVDQKTWSHSMKIFTVGGIVVIAAVIFGVVKTIEKYEREAQIVKPLPEQLQAVPRSEEQVGVPPSADLLQGEQPLSSPVAAASVLPERAATIPEGVVTPTALPSPVLSMLATPTAMVTPTPTPVSSKKSHEVIVEALDKVTIEYSIDGKPGATMTLTAEKVHTFRGDKKISLSVSDGGSVNLIYNGKDKGVPGNLGKALKVSFP